MAGERGGAGVSNRPGGGGEVGGEASGVEYEEEDPYYAAETGLRSFPSLFSFPPEKDVDKWRLFQQRHWPTIVSLMQDHALEKPETAVLTTVAVAPGASIHVLGGDGAVHGSSQQHAWPGNGANGNAHLGGEAGGEHHHPAFAAASGGSVNGGSWGRKQKNLRPTMNQSTFMPPSPVIGRRGRMMGRMLSSEAKPTMGLGSSAAAATAAAAAAAATAAARRSGKGGVRGGAADDVAVAAAVALGGTAGFLAGGRAGGDGVGGEDSASAGGNGNAAAVRAASGPRGGGSGGQWGSGGQGGQQLRPRPVFYREPRMQRHCAYHVVWVEQTMALVVVVEESEAARGGSGSVAGGSGRRATQKEKEGQYRPPKVVLEYMTEVGSMLQNALLISGLRRIACSR